MSADPKDPKSESPEGEIPADLTSLFEELERTSSGGGAAQNASAELPPSIEEFTPQPIDHFTAIADLPPADVPPESSPEPPPPPPAPESEAPLAAVADEIQDGETPPPALDLALSPPLEDPPVFEEPPPELEPSAEAAAASSDSPELVQEIAPVFEEPPPLDAPAPIGAEAATPPEEIGAEPPALEDPPALEELPAPTPAPPLTEEPVLAATSTEVEMAAPAVEPAPIPEATAAPTIAAPASTVDAIQKYSNTVKVAKGAVPAEFPFHLRISGQLTAGERSRLTDLLEKHRFGIAPEDLEAQFDAGRILLPRLSEYAAVLVVQALRDAQVEFDLRPSEAGAALDADISGPSDESLSMESENQATRQFPDSVVEPIHPAERIPMTTGETLPGQPGIEVLDLLTSSAVVKTREVTAEASEEYQVVLESLKKELQYKAFRRGATGVIRFQATLTRMFDTPYGYRLMVFGSAIRGSTSTRETDAVATTATADLLKNIVKPPRLEPH